eukprot:4155934-Amphidinium_carterae.1
MQQGQGIIVTDSKLQAGTHTRKPRGRLSRVEERICAAVGDMQVQWMRSHLTAVQAVEADIPARYHAGNAEVDVLASEAVQEVPGLPTLFNYFTQAAGAARNFWALCHKLLTLLGRNQIEQRSRAECSGSSAASFPSAAEAKCLLCGVF